MFSRGLGDKDAGTRVAGAGSWSSGGVGFEAATLIILIQLNCYYIKYKVL
jgi:hypothetical protein